MSKTVWKASAPSNIALIKYMGKESEGKNRPTNNSLSLSLDHLKSYVEIEEIDDDKDQWSPLEGLSYSMKLSDKGKNKFLNHWAFLKQKFSLNGNYLIRSANDFPSDCGLASSASSFAALTYAAFEVYKEKQSELVASKEQKDSFFSPWSFTSFFNESVKKNNGTYSDQDLALLSASGSGSSCRSFFSPWSVWDKQEGPKEFINPHYENLGHHVVVVDDSPKDVSSSEAHQRIRTSLLFEGRTERAEKRLKNLEEAFKNKDWKLAFEITWAEFWDMHSLFETSHPSFRYISPKSQEVLTILQDFWREKKDGPIVTMDAGANVHLLFRKDQKNSLQKELYELLSKDFKVL